MIKAVLFDLDDTLLQTNDTVFIQAYLQAAEAYFRQRYQHQGISTALMKSLKAMGLPRHNGPTNIQIALQSIASGGTHTETELASMFDRFYIDAYPPLKSYTEPIAAAPHLINMLLKQNYAVVIATNPVYPTEAIRQRIEWAGLPTNFKNYTFVTTGDNMHFIKPQPEYYAEILARIGVEPDEALMVGNTAENDIIPAQILGLNTYHITTTEPPSTQADASGSLEDFTYAVQQGWLENLSPHPLQPQMVIPELRGNIGALFGQLDEVKPHQWVQLPVPAEWSILQIVAHLVERETQVQRPRLQTILQKENPFIRNPAPPPTPSNEGDATTGLRLAHEFARERQITVELLQSLSDADWKRTAQHSVFGSTNFLEMAHFTAQHDRMHITQICQTLGKCD